MAAPRKDNVKEKILEATAGLLEHKTLSDISLAEIAAASGVSKGTLYYHYKTKTEILFDITDRYLDSSLAYQAGGRELTSDEIRGLSMWATGGLLPRRTYLLDIDPACAHRRLTHAADRIESAADDFQRRTRRAFLDLAERGPERCLVLDASAPAGDIAQTICQDSANLVG